MTIRPITKHDRDWIRSLLSERWGSPEVVTRGRIHYADQLPGFMALNEEHPVGLVTYTFEKGDCEIVSLDSLESGKGIGLDLINAVINTARIEQCNRVWLFTTNDNTRALRFYQKIGFKLVAIHCNAIKKSREIKPSIPEIGFDNIPIRDEIELELKIEKIPDKAMERTTEAAVHGSH